MGTPSSNVTTARIQERRANHGSQFARVLLDTQYPVCFGDLIAAAPSVSTRELADWLGHAIGDGLVAERDPGPEGERCFGLTARGRRILAAHRRKNDAA
jgi:hypothetical protein